MQPYRCRASCLRTILVYAGLILAVGGMDQSSKANDYRPGHDRVGESLAAAMPPAPDTSTAIPQAETTGPTPAKTNDEDGPKWTDCVMAVAAIASVIFSGALWYSTQALQKETQRLVEGGERQGKIMLDQQKIMVAQHNI